MPDVQPQITGTVRTVDPLTVWPDGSTSWCPAATIAGQVYLSGDRVQITVRNPLPPLLQGLVIAP